MRSSLVFIFTLSLALLSPAFGSSDIKDLLGGISNELDSKFNSGATKSLSNSLGAPAITKVFNKEDISKYNSLYDLVNTVPSTVVDMGPWGRRFIQIRNINNQIFNNKVLFLVNGFKIAESTSFNFDLDSIPIHAVKRLEVIRGPGSVLYGSSAYSGVINVITHDGSGYQRDSVNLSVGTHGTFSNSFNKSFQKNSNQSHFFSFQINSSNGTEKMNDTSLNFYRNIPNGYARVPLGQELERTFPSDASDFRIEEKNYSLLGQSKMGRWNFTYGSSRVNRELSYLEATPTPFFGGVLPQAFLATRTQAIYQALVQGGTAPAVAQVQAMAQAQALLAGTTINPNLPYFDPGRVRSYSDVRMDLFGAQYEASFNENTSMKAFFKYSDLNESLKEFDRNIFNVKGQGTSKEIEFQFFHKPSPKWDLTIGAQKEWISFGQLSYDRNNIIAATNQLNQVLGTPLLNGPFHSVLPGSMNLSGFYIQNIYSPSKKWQILFAGRKNQHPLIDDSYTPKFAITYKLDDDEYLKIMHGKAFRYPTPFELYANLPPVNFRGSLNLRSEQVEGTEYNWVRSFGQGTKNFSITYYDMKLSQFISSSSISFANSPVPLTSKGWEFEWDHEISDRFSYWFNLTLADLKDPVSTTGKSTSEYSKMASFGLDYKINSRFFLTTSSKWIGRRANNQTLLLTDQPSQIYHDLSLNYQHSKHRQIRLQVLNLFDEEAHSPLGTVASPKLQPTIGGRKFIVSYRVEF